MKSAGPPSSAASSKSSWSSRPRRLAMISPLTRCYHEFRDFYVRERAAWVAERPERDAWAPRSPRRLFNLAVRTLYRAYRRRLSVWQFVGAVYDTLGLASGDGPGLFGDFNPAKYHGNRPLQDHFAAMFKRRVW